MSWREMSPAMQAGGQCILCESCFLCLPSSASLSPCSLQSESRKDIEKEEAISHEELLQVQSVLLQHF